jgi:hypothetical protein
LQDDDVFSSAQVFVDKFEGPFQFDDHVFFRAALGISTSFEGYLRWDDMFFIDPVFPTNP